MKAETVLLNGKIYSVNLDNSLQHGTAVAIKDGLITAVENDKDIKELIDEDTCVIDCRAKTIIPGL